MRRSRRAGKDTKRLLSQIVTRIELHFEDDTIGRRKRSFTHGDIYVRPDVGENREIQPGGEVTHMIKKRPYLEREAVIAEIPQTGGKRRAIDAIARNGQSGVLRMRRESKDIWDFG